ncbi:MAG: hypothetical protein O3B01_13920 [Planctomycetota bacterium]|nr:hypothetical protein [Planctomycetota bacterium]MDA1139666.1 hypothetical protein [Planctomycetota bacterium]
MSNRPALAGPGNTITVGGQVSENFMNSVQTRAHIQDASANFEGNATNNIMGQETNYQQTNSKVATAVESGDSLGALVSNTNNLEIIDLGNKINVDVRQSQNVDIAQIGYSEDGAVATNNAYFNENNTQLSDVDNGVKVTAGNSASTEPVDPSNYLLNWLSATKSGGAPVGGVNQNRSGPVFDFAIATSELSPESGSILSGLIRSVGREVNSESRLAARALYALARMVGTGGNSDLMNRNAARLEEALQPLDPNVGYDYSGSDASVFASAIQHIVNTIPNYIADNPDLLAEIQYALADITNTLSPGGQVNMVA